MAGAALAWSAWMWVGVNPSVEAGSFGGPVSGITVRTDTFGTTWVMSDTEAVLRESIRNTGPFPVTITGIVSQPANQMRLTAWYQTNWFQDVDAPPIPPAAEETVTVRPGAVVGVDIHLEVPPCRDRILGPIQFSGAEFEVRSAGMTTTQWVSFDGAGPLLIPGWINHECVERVPTG